MQICSMDELPCYSENACINDELDDLECEEGSSQEFEDNESTEAVREEVHKSPSYDYILEQDVNQQINHIDDVSLESSEYSARTSVELQEKQSPIREEEQPRFCINNYSPARTSFPSTNSYIAGDTQSPGQTTAMAADKYQTLIKSPNVGVREVEIIDIFTPSPCLEKSGSKKRRPNLWPEVIDLTNSPIYV